MSTVPAQGGGLPKSRSLRENPRLSDWITVGSDGTITVRVGKVEIGQGIITALAQVVGEELGVDLDRVTMVPASTAAGPDEGFTSGSLSVAESGTALRHVCAHVRAAFVEAAADRWSVDAATVSVHGGVIADASGARTTTYGEMAAQVDLGHDVDGSVEPRSRGETRVVGSSVARLDLPDKIAGRPRFIHDLVLPGQLYGCVVRPPSPGARLTSVQPPATPLPDGVVEVVRDGSFLGVVAVDEDIARRAADRLRADARWEETDTLPDEGDIPAFLRAGPHDTRVVTDRAGAEAVDSAARTVVRASYNSSYLAHASMAPSCGAAQWTDGKLQVWTHSQGVHPLRDAIAQVLAIERDDIVVQHVEGAGCYGHNAADDAAFDAVLLARAVPGRPVLARWSRTDELSWAPFGSAMSIDMEAVLDADGRVAEWSHEAWGQGFTSRPGSGGTPNLLAGAHMEGGTPLGAAVDPAPERGYGLGRNAHPIYAFAGCKVLTHRVLTTPLRSSALRSLGAFANVFAIESFMDELSAAAGRDPLQFRLEHLEDERARAVLLAATELAGWETREQRREESVGFGIGFARYKNLGAYCAVVAEVEAVETVRVRRLAVAIDVGQVVNPDGVRNQLEGGAVQATSWTLKERVRFDRRRVTSTDWETYPILRFSESPAVDVTIVSQPDHPSMGAGEAAQGPTAAAIANAVADALSVRVRDLPLTSDTIVAAFDA